MGVDFSQRNAGARHVQRDAGTLERVSESVETVPRTNTPERLSGLGRVLIAVYIVLALAATFRSIYQIISKFDEAPLAYVLSAVAGLVYILAAVALICRASVLWRGIAWAALTFELAGVLIVGTLSLVMPELFAHPSVWSVFGQGYLFIPLVLPVLGLIWLNQERAKRRGSEALSSSKAASSADVEEDTVGKTCAP